MANAQQEMHFNAPRCLYAWLTQPIQASQHFYEQGFQLGHAHVQGLEKRISTRYEMWSD